jgi:hypothetical protein
VSAHLLAFDLPGVEFVDNAAESAILSLVLMYALAAWFNTRIPHTGVEMRPLRHDPRAACWPVRWNCCPTLALQPPPVERPTGPDLAGYHHVVLGCVGQPALHRARLERCWLGYSTTQASALVGVVAIGTAVRQVVASMHMR